jgi:hypothetical protein
VDVLEDILLGFLGQFKDIAVEVVAVDYPILEYGVIPSNTTPKLLNFSISQWTLQDSKKEKAPDFSGAFVSLRIVPDIQLAEVSIT